MATQRSNDSLLRIIVVVLGVIVLLPVLMMALTMPMMGETWHDGVVGGMSPLWGSG